MKKIIRFDIYKSIKSISTWILLLSVIVFSVASLAITYLSKTAGEMPDVALEIGEQMTTVSIKDMSVIDWCIDSITGDFLMLFVAVFAILFTCSDYSSGFIKNIYGSIKCKWQYVFSKMAIVSIFTIFTIFLAYVVTIIFNLTVVHSQTFGDVSVLLKFTVFKAILLIAYGCVSVLVSFVMRKATVGLIVCMGYSFMFANMLYAGINQIVKGIGISDTFDIQKYTLLGNTISLTSSISNEQQWIIISVSTIFALIAFVFSVFCFEKRDV